MQGVLRRDGEGKHAQMTAEDIVSAGSDIYFTKQKQINSVFLEILGQLQPNGTAMRVCVCVCMRACVRVCVLSLIHISEPTRQS